MRTQRLWVLFEVLACGVEHRRSWAFNRARSAGRTMRNLREISTSEKCCGLTCYHIMSFFSENCDELRIDDGSFDARWHSRCFYQNVLGFNGLQITMRVRDVTCQICSCGNLSFKRPSSGLDFDHLERNMHSIGAT